MSLAASRAIDDRAKTVALAAYETAPVLLEKATHEPQAYWARER